jgi:serine/threonine protein kinase
MKVSKILICINVSITFESLQKMEPSRGTGNGLKAESNLPSRKRKVNRDLSCLRINSQVGSGMYGTVFKAVDQWNGESVALKCIKLPKETEGFPVTAVREIKLLKAMNHENIISLHEIVTYARCLSQGPHTKPNCLISLIDRYL